MTRSEKIDLLENFSTFLAANGYMDEDWRSEPPFAIDEFLRLTPDPVEPTAKAEKKYTLSEVLDIMAAYSICPSDYSVAETKKDFPHQFKGKREDAEKWIIKNF